MIELSSIIQSRILIIDDDLSNVRLLERILKKGGFTSSKSLSDSRLALATVEKFQPDLILLDLHMPRVDGFEVIQQLRNDGTEQNYRPILVLTADVTPGAKNKALAMGAKDFLAKPLDQIEVLLRVRNLLETRFLYQRLAQTLRESHETEPSKQPEQAT